MFNYSKGEKAVAGVLAFVMIYGLLTYIFSIGNIFDATDKTIAFFSSIPYLWPAKILLSVICVIPMLFFGRNLNDIRCKTCRKWTARYCTLGE